MLQYKNVQNFSGSKRGRPTVKRRLNSPHIQYIPVGETKALIILLSILPLKRNLLSIYSISGPKQSTGNTDINNKHNGCPLGIPSLVQRDRSGNKAFLPTVIGVNCFNRIGHEVPGGPGEKANNFVGHQGDFSRG